MLKCLVCVVLCCPLAVSAAPTVVTLAVDDAHASEGQEADDQDERLDVQLLQRAAEQLPGWRVQFQSMPWPRALMEAEQGRVDGILPAYRNADRPWLQLYIGPLHHEVVVLSCTPGSGLGADSHWPADFLSRRVGMVRGYFLSEALSDAVAQKQVRKIEYSNGRDALAALKEKQIDCLADDLASIESVHRQALADPVWAGRVPLTLEAPLALSDQETFVAVSERSLSLRPELARFAKVMDEQLALLRHNGALARPAPAAK